MKYTHMTGALAGLFALAAFGAAAPSATAGEMVLTYIHPETFYDLPFSPTDREDLLKNVADHFIDKAKALPPDQELKVEVLDFDPAGRLYPSFHGGQELRVLRGAADWPRMTLRFTLTSHGQTLASGEDTISNMMYQHRFNHYFDSDPLRYEKQMIDDWFKKRFGVSDK